MKNFRKSCIFYIVILMTILSLSSSIMPVMAANPIQHWENSKRYLGTYADAYNSESLANYGAVWIPSRYKWEWTYKLSGTGAVRAHSGYSTQLDYATIDIKEYNDTQDNLAIWTSSASEYLGTIPRSAGPQPDYSAAGIVVSYAIGVINLLLPPGSGFFWTTAQVIVGMRSAYDVAINTATRTMRQWVYPYTRDAEQYIWFLADVKPNKTVYFTHEYDIQFRDVYFENHLHLGPYLMQMTAPGPGSGLTSGWNPSMLTATEKLEYGIEEIPINKLKARAAELGIPVETINELTKSGETVVYFAHNLPVKQIPIK